MKWFVKDSSFYRSFFSLTFVIALQNLIAFSVNLADSMMLGAYNETALSAAAVCNQIQFLLQMVLNGIVAGLVVICAQYWGKRQTQPIKKLFAVAFWLAVGMSFLIGLISLFFPNLLLSLLTNEAEVIKQAKEYLGIIAFSYVIFALTSVIIGLMRSIEKVKIGFWVSLAALFVNMTLNYGLIYGRFGMPEMGIRGAAIATLISRVFELVIVVFYAGVLEQNLKLRLADIFKLEKSYFKDFLKTGMPTVLSSTSWGIAMAVQGAILGRLGASTIAASSIATTIFQVAVVLAGGSANASNVVIGKAVGYGDMQRVKDYAKTMQILFLGIGVFTGLVLFSARGYIIGFYNIRPETAQLAKRFLLVLSITVVGTAYQMPSLTGIVAGGGDTKFVLYNDIIFMWGLVLPLAALSAFVFQLPVVYTFVFLKIDQILKCAVAVVKVNRFKWIKILTKEAT
ncbi:MAG: MATE family efflux transporter [Clostridiales bacterium]|nr:MATE family efflux transporter [Clostridiales bacterium]